MDGDRSQPRTEALCRGVSTSVVADSDLHCPLCGYNLHGLGSRVCPECGSPFDPQLLRDQIKARGHPWLFEHGRWPSLRRFVRTVFASLRLSPLWRNIDPGHFIRVSRLVLHLVVVILISGLGVPALRAAEHAAIRIEPPWGGAGFPVWVNWVNSLRTLGPFWPLLLWPVASLAALAIFRETLGKARIRTAQLFRAIVYSFDVVLLTAILLECLRLGAYAFVAEGVNYSAYSNPVLPRSITWYVGPRNLTLTEFAAVGSMFLALTYRLCRAGALYLRIPGIWIDLLLSQVAAVLAVVVFAAVSTDLPYRLMIALR